MQSPFAKGHLMRESSHAARDWLRKIRKAWTKAFFTPSISREGRLKLPAGIFLNAIRRAPRGYRRELFRRLLSSRSVSLPPSSAEVCEFKSLDNFESAYIRLAALLGLAGKTPPPGELEFLRSIANRQIKYPGTIGTSDYFFLTAFVGILAPRHLVEIGTLTGFSAAIIAAALLRQHGKESEPWVDTIDVRPKCLIDETRPTGFEISESFPEFVSTIRLHIPNDSAVVSKLAKREELEVAFVDGDHRHPLPLLDLLRLAPYVRSGGWIVLHDIQLGTIGRQAIEAGQTLRWGTAYGVEWLFGSWPFVKISGGNIGAVQLPNDKSQLIPFALRLMSIPFESTGKNAHVARRALYRCFAELL
jgi:predicted O-methyltransferase YrrM